MAKKQRKEPQGLTHVLALETDSASFATAAPTATTTTVATSGKKRRRVSVDSEADVGGSADADKQALPGKAPSRSRYGHL